MKTVLNTAPDSTSPARGRVGARLAAIVALVALPTLAGCSPGTPPKVTVTIPYPVSSPTPQAPDPIPTEPPDNPTGIALGVSMGGVSPSCTNTTCWYLYLEWEGLTKGSHQVQCASDDLDPNVFSDNSYYFETTSGERELKCFLGHPGSHVWVVIDGMYSSNHVDWG